MDFRSEQAFRTLIFLEFGVHEHLSCCGFGVKNNCDSLTVFRRDNWFEIDKVGLLGKALVTGNPILDSRALFVVHGLLLVNLTSLLYYCSRGWDRFGVGRQTCLGRSMEFQHIIMGSLASTGTFDTGTFDSGNYVQKKTVLVLPRFLFYSKDGSCLSVKLGVNWNCGRKTSTLVVALRVVTYVHAGTIPDPLSFRWRRKLYFRNLHSHSLWIRRLQRNLVVLFLTSSVNSIV
jgi:hypothetical protein